MKTKEFFKQKTDQDLYKIYKGGTTTYNEKLLAQETLKERGFDFNNINSYKEEWELEKLEKEIIEEKNAIQGFLVFNPLYFRFFSIAILIGAVYITVSVILELTSIKEIILEHYLMIAMSIIFWLLGIGGLRYSITRGKYLKYRTQRLEELR
ncbi:hypothetical protein [Carboxylicivirga taeanensis]|uniref:hypothetical protein n=1 Tax=Carboxylicivirga taeanensis TaxID=1416875 RepID=UPI003F6DE8C3